MKYYVFSRVLLLMMFSILGVSIMSGQEDGRVNATEFVRLTVNKELLNGTKEILSWDLLETEKEGFEKAFDSIAKCYYAEFEQFYLKEYSQDEIAQLLVFYKTSLGSKLANDLGKMYQSNIGEPTLGDLMAQIQKENKEGRRTENRTQIVSEGNADVTKLLGLVRAQEYLAAVKYYQYVNVPHPDISLITTFDTLTANYLLNLEQYFHNSYSTAELKEILGFYETPLGKKVAGNSLKLINATISANDKWAGNIKKLMRDITSGKFQRSNKKG